MPALRIKRGTRAQLEAAKSAGTLAAGEPYLITDENRQAIGTGANSYTAAAAPELQQTWTAHQTFGQLSGGTDTTASASGNITLALDGKCKRLTLTGNVTLTLSVPNGASWASALVIFIQDGTGGRTVTWNGSPKLLDSQALNTGANKHSAWVVWTPDGGTTLYLSGAGAES